jgi:HD-like signal output (HDOD) protein
MSVTEPESPPHVYTFGTGNSDLSFRQRFDEAIPFPDRGLSRAVSHHGNFPGQRVTFTHVKLGKNHVMHPKLLVRPAEWALVHLHSPGKNLRPAGVLLLDSISDKLYLRLDDDLTDVDDDIKEVWAELGPDLELMSLEIGAVKLLKWLEDCASNAIRIGHRQQIQTAAPEMAVEELFRQHVCINLRSERAMASGSSDPLFSSNDIARACSRLPISSVIGLQALSTLQDPTSDMRNVEVVVEKDPVITAHLIKLSNSALWSYGRVVCSLRAALVRIGLNTAKLQILGLSLRSFYSAPDLQGIWDHSLQAVQAMRDLCDITGFAQVGEASLAALVHDIGRIALNALGERFRNQYNQFRRAGELPAEIERLLCGASHSEIGADLLSRWNFGADVVEAVRYHHDPSNAKRRLSHLLYIVESTVDEGEDIYYFEQHARVIEQLGLNGRELLLGRRQDPDLALLRFAA